MITREHRELEDAVRKVVMQADAIKRIEKLEAIAEAAKAFCSDDTPIYDAENYENLKAAVDALYGEKELNK